WMASAAESPGHLKYAPDREADILHLKLEVTPDFAQRTVAGVATVRFQPVGKPLAELRLDGVDLRVSAVTASGVPVAGWQSTGQEVVVTFAEPLPAGREATVVVTYEAVPQKGLYFRTPAMGYRPEDMHVWTQGEPFEARHWFPCVDAPNEKFTSEVICHVPPAMAVLSNGRRVGQPTTNAAGLKAVHWLQDKPHTAYLIAMVAGHVKGIFDRHGDLELGFYTPVSQFAEATNSFRETREMMEFFEREIGVPFPWARYDQVVVDDFSWGGMENTTLTILTDRTLHRSETENLVQSVGLVAHELAHQWFGDLVTCKDWSHLWLNEGFATYYTHLYEGHRSGRDSMLYGLRQAAKGFMATANDTNAIVRRDFNSPEEQFGFHAYPKGAWILHMLRSELGPELFRRCVKVYLDRHAYGTATTDDLRQVFEELSGRTLDQFFNQYVYHAHQPALNISYSWDERTRLARISVAQVQRLSEDVLLFNVPLKVRFHGGTGHVDRVLRVKAKEEDFYVALPETPRGVRMDPDTELLAKIQFTPPAGMLDRQLQDGGDMVGRLLAVEQLSGKAEALGKLERVLTNDTFWGVRLAASQSIRAIGTDDALEALVRSARQQDARVRRQVVQDIGGFLKPAAREFALRVAREEKNPEIRASALATLGAWQGTDGVRAELLKGLRMDSYRGQVPAGALTGIRGQDDSSYLQPVLETVARREKDWPSGVVGQGLETLAWLARQEDKKDAVREFLVARVNSPRRRVQQAALAGLGTLGDPKAMAVLEKFSSLPADNRERATAERSLTALREARRPSVELGSLRGDVSKLQQENRDLRKELDDLKRRLEAVVPKAAPAKETKK
ncbi:MAG: Aminopeptidase, partial [Verrucomicrobiota bacterium]